MSEIYSKIKFLIILPNDFLTYFSLGTQIFYASQKP